MATSSRLAAHRQASAVAVAAQPVIPAAEPEIPGEEEETDEPKEDQMTTETKENATKAAVAPDAAAVTASANERWNTVLSAEAAKGREAVARDLLAKTPMSAEDIIATLGNIPVAAADDGGQAGADAVLAALKGSQPEVGTEGGDAAAAAAANNHGWDAIHAEIRERRSA